MESLVNTNCCVHDDPASDRSTICAWVPFLLATFVFLGIFAFSILDILTSLLIGFTVWIIFFIIAFYLTRPEYKQTKLGDFK